MRLDGEQRRIFHKIIRQPNGQYAFALGREFVAWNLSKDAVIKMELEELVKDAFEEAESGTISVGGSLKYIAMHKNFEEKKQVLEEMGYFLSKEETEKFQEQAERYINCAEP